MCLSCREMKPKAELIRIVMNKSGDVSLDFTGKLQGRGAYICNDKTCFAKLRKTNGIERNFKIKVDPEIYERIESELD